MLFLADSRQQVIVKPSLITIICSLLFGRDAILVSLSLRSELLLGNIVSLSWSGSSDIENKVFVHCCRQYYKNNRLLMGKQDNHKKMLENRKNRKEFKIQKSQGNAKKFTKNDLNKPPNLSQFKNKMIQSLKSKEANRDKTIENLEKEKVPDIQHLMEDIQFEEEGADVVDDGGFELYEGKNFQESGKYWKEIKKIIETCDIILEILDARDPLSCRCKYIQRKILSMPDKKIVLVLNKIDLIPMENAYAWQTYLRRQYPVVMFKANLQSQGSHLSSFNLFKKSIADSTDMADTLIHSTKAIGTDHLIQLIKQISKVEGSNRAVTVGLIGYPNVGKSSVINSLKRNKACEVSSIPGCTKALQQVKLDSQVKLLDCPGVIFEKDLTRNQLILQNTAKYDDALEEVIDAILERIPMHELLQYYKIEPFTSTVEFLAKICRAHGKLGKGGVPEMKQGAKLVVQDWNKGNLKYFTIPPIQQERERAQQQMLQQ